MRVPKRRGEAKQFIKQDPAMTKQKYQELKNKLDFMKKVKHPQEAEEVKRLALMGDFSENAAYQLAKGRLRGLNQRILNLENLLNRAEIITTDGNKERINLGAKVTLKSASGFKQFKILGSVETNPTVGIISHTSPLGSALMGKKVGDKIKIKLKNKELEYKIIKIE
ncbi:MAG: GreA/GreB family elongation factor [Patescibacteria group bacterium]|jgi:transcription elongation factor GreA|nr:GreA/GreB family elongation factor [bacterium]HQC49557.1 GreA/GreB family elongation factor [bacterium]